MKGDKWSWLAYPLGVIVLMVLSAKLATGPGVVGLEALSRRRVDVQQQEELAERLRVKVNVLRTISGGKTTEELKILLAAVPASPKILAMVEGVKMAVGSAGGSVESYSAKVGSLREATVSGVATGNALRLELMVSLPGLRDVSQAVKLMEKALPLMRVVGVSYNRSGNVEMVVEQTWQPWGSVVVEAEAPIPDIESRVAEVQRRLMDFGLEAGSSEGASLSF